jgi:FkbM family methyltransferase
VALSAITGPEIRRHFPAGHTEIAAIPCRSGLELKADMSDIFAASAAFGRLQEADDFEAVMSLVAPGAVVVDVGANFGLYAAHAALYAGEKGAVFAFEPMPAAYGLLADNIADNDLCCTTVCAAVGTANGMASFRVAADSSFSGLKDTGRSTTVGQIDVEVIALDAFAPLARLSPDLIKIDVEGGEQAVLRGARNLLARAPDVLVMFEFSYKNLDSASRAELIAELDDLAELGFGLYRRNPAGHGVERLAPVELQGDLSENLFLVRPDSAMADRLMTVMRRPVGAPSLDQAATIAVLRRFDRLWRTSEELTKVIRDTAMTDFSLTLGADLVSDFKLYRDAGHDAVKQQQAAAILDAKTQRHRAVALEKQVAQAQRAQRAALDEANKAKLALDELRKANKAINAALEGHRAALANTQGKYEDASAARDWLIGQIAELKARHGIVDPDPQAGS